MNHEQCEAWLALLASEAQAYSDVKQAAMVAATDDLQQAKEQLHRAQMRWQNAEQALASYRKAFGSKEMVP
jgi:hypothetical protein